MKNKFGEQLRKLRLQSYNCMKEAKKALTQSAFVEQLHECVGLIYSHAAVSNWERGQNKINHEERMLLVGIIQVLFKCGGIDSIEEANQLLACGGYGRLTNKEIESISSAWLHNYNDVTASVIRPSVAAQIATLPIMGNLIGVETVTANIVQRLADGIASVHVAITGRKGSGKSAVANAVVRRFLETSTFTQVVWLPVVDESGFAQSFATRLGEKLRLSEFGSVPTTIQFHQLKNSLQQTRCLIVIDGIKTEVELEAVSSFVSQLPPPTRVLVTTRIIPTSNASAYFHPISVAELNATDSQTVLQQLNPALTGAHCKTIFERVGGHPDTLRLLSIYSHSRSIQHMLDAFEHLHTQEAEKHFEMIYAEIWKGLSTETQHLLQLLCFISIDGVSEETLRVAGAFGDISFSKALEEATRVGLIYLHGSPDTFWYSIHQLTRQYIMAKGSSLHEESLAMIVYWQQRFDALDSAEWHLLDRNRHNIFQTIKFSLRFSDTYSQLQLALCQLAMTLYNFVDQRGLTSSYLPVQQALVASKWLTDQQQGLLYSQLGTLLRKQQNLDDAINAHEKALTIAEKCQDDGLQGRAQYNLAIDYRQQQLYERANDLAAQANSSFLASNEIGLLIATINLQATIALYLGQFIEAEQQLNQALELAIEHSIRQTTRAAILINLGQAYRNQQNFSQAFESLARAQDAIAGQETSQHHTLWQELSSMHLANQDPEQALAVLKQFDLKQLETTSQLFRVALVQHNMGNAFYLQTYYGKAELILRHAVRLWKLLKNEPRLARTHKLLGDVLYAKNSSKQAQKHWTLAYELAIAFPSNARLHKLVAELEGKINV